jgi:hypothetical protein
LGERTSRSEKIKEKSSIGGRQPAKTSMACQYEPIFTSGYLSVFFQTYSVNRTAIS